MNVNKNTVYYVNLGVFVLLAVYSLLFSINAFNFENIDMNAGLCAVVVIMVIALLMYVVQATRLASVLYSMPLAKITLEIVSTLFLLTAACVIKVYFLEQLEIYIVREGIVLVCIFMAYLVARMLNQFGFITLLVLAPWPLLLNTYNLDMSQLIVMVEIMAVLLVVTLIFYMVRHQKKFKNMMMGVFCVAVVGLLVYVMYSQGNQIVQVANPMQYISKYEAIFEFAELERFYYIGVITAAILGAIRMWFGKGSGNSLVAFAASATFVTMVLCGIGGQYMYMMYPVLAIVASGACGTRPAYMDEEVKLNDNMEGVSANYNKKPSVETSYVDESELDKMLDELESNKPYSKAGSPFNPVKFAAESSEEEEMPIELQMYDFGSDASASQPVTPVVEEKKDEQEPFEEKKVESSPETVTEVVEEVVEEVAETVEEKVSETAKQVAEQVACEVAEVVEEPVVVEEIIEVVDEVAMEPEVAKETIEDVVEEIAVEEPEVEEPVVEVPVMEETVKEEIIVEEPQMEETGSLTSAVEFEMPVFAMDTVAFTNENVSSEEQVEPVMEELTEIVDEVSVDDSAKLVVTDESAESISSTEEFSMPTFEMDTVAMDNVSEIFEEEKAEAVVEEVIENVEEKAEEVKDDLIIAVEDAGSVAMSEEFSMPTFEMSSFVETVDVIEEITSEPVTEPLEEPLEEIVEEEQVVLVQNPIFIKNPINFNRTRSYESQSEENKNYEFEFSAPTFETMGSFLEDNKENSFPQFETTQGAIDEFVNSFVTDEEEKTEEKVAEESVEEVVVEEFSAIENISFDANAEEDVVEVNTDSDAAGGIFEYSTEETGRIDDIEMPGFMASDFDSTDLFGTFNPNSVDEDEDYDDSATREVVVEPETVELGLDLDEEFSFGQAQSLTDWYDYDSAAPSFIVDEPEVEATEAEETVEEVAEEFIAAEETVEEVAEEVIEEFTEAVIEDVAVQAVIAEVETEVESVNEVAVSGKDDDVYDWDAADAKFAYEDETEIVTENVVNEIKSTDSDYFDWSAYDAYDFDEEEKQEADVAAETVETSSPVSSNSFEEFVWTDEMIKAMETEEKLEEKFDTAVEEIGQAVDEVAASMEYDYSSDEPDQYEVFQSTGNFVPEVEEVVEETQYEVFQSTGNFVPEVEEVVEETQYEVFQSTGNFVPEVEEVVEETQYEVFQSTGNFVPEVEEVVEEIQYKTYGQEDESDDVGSEKDSKANDYDSSQSKEFQLDLPDFDLDLPNF